MRSSGAVSRRRLSANFGLDTESKAPPNLVRSSGPHGMLANSLHAGRSESSNNSTSFFIREARTFGCLSYQKSHDYLGTIIAYRDVQSNTVTHRLKKARGQYSQLRKTINSARIEAPANGHQAMASRQMRAIARRPAHVSHLTNAQVRQALNAEEPLAALHAQGEKYL